MDHRRKRSLRYDPIAERRCAETRRREDFYRRLRRLPDSAAPEYREAYVAGETTFLDPDLDAESWAEAYQEELIDFPDDEAEGEELVRSMNHPRRKRRIFRENGSSEEMARNVREVFTDRESQYVTDYDWDWPSSMQDIGTCLSVMYRSDKWNPGTYTDYKHVAEGPQRVLVESGFLEPYPGARITGLSGPRVRVPGLPAQFAELADCIGLQCELNDGTCVQIDLGGMKLGGLKYRGRAWLCVFDRSGCKVLIDGAKLDIQKDGITG